jgi:prevent-host-death family protein
LTIPGRDARWAKPTLVKAVKQIDIFEARTHLSSLVDQVSHGESFVIARSGTPLAKLVPLSEGKPARIGLGLMKGKIRIAEDFDAPLRDEIIDAFEGGKS